MNQNLILFLLRHFYRLVLGLAGLGMGLMWAVFGLRKTLVILCLTVLGFLIGKWMDEGRPDGGWLRWLGKQWD